MADISKNTATVYVTREVTEALAVEPTNGSQAVSVTSDGFEMNGEKALVERNNMTSSISKALPRVGIKTSSVTLTVEAKANSVAGVTPEAGLLFEACLGATRSNTNSITTITTTNLTTIPVSAITGLAVGDVVMFKDSNGYHITPLTAVAANGTNDDTVTCLIPFAVAPASNTAIEKSTSFYGANSGHPSLTVTTYLEDALKMQSAGCRVASLSLDGFETGGIASFNFGLNGTGYDESVAASGLTASFSGATPPLVLEACVYKDGTAIPVTALSWSVENTLAQKLSTCAANGILGQKITQRVVSGSFTPYMDTTSVALFDDFDANTQFSICGFLSNPGASAGQKKEVIGFYLPVCIITAAPHSDADGLMQYNLEFSTGPDAAGSQIYITFS
jgi:hypothetical protein